MRLKLNKNNSSQKGTGKLVQHLTLRSALRLRVGISILVVLAVGFIMLLNFMDHGTVQGAVNGDYRSKASGNWNATSTWQKFSGGSWINAVATPTSADGVIEIMAGHTVTVSASVTADQVVIDAGGSLTISSSQALTIANGSGTDLTVNGTLTNAGTITQNASSTIAVNGLQITSTGATHTIGASATTTINNGGIYRDDGGTLTTAAGWTVNSGGVYQDNTNGSTLPVATWNSGSTCDITGVTSTAPANLNQSFQNFTWDCASQSADINLNAVITAIGGDFTVANTNASQLLLSSTGSTTTVSGNFIQSGGSFVLSTAGSGTPTLTISGDFTQSAGTFTVVTGNGITGTVKVAGNWTRTGGTIILGGDASTNAQFIFNKSGTQTFNTTGAVVTGNVDFTVNSGSTLVMANNILTGRNFTLSSGGGISLGSSAGITSSGSTGNIQVSGTRSYSTGADYTYNGTTAQNTGNGLPATVHNFILNNSNGLTLTATVSVSNILTLTTGLLYTGANEVKTNSATSGNLQGYSSSSYVVGNLRRKVNGSGTYDFPIGTAGYYELASITLSSVTGFTDLLGTFTNSSPIDPGYPLSGVYLANLLVDQMLDYGYWTFTPGSAMSGGTYTITVTEKGNAVSTGPSYSYCILKRANTSSSWQSTGTHIQGAASGTALTAGRSGLNSFGDFGIGYGQAISFANVSLISGVSGQVNSIYKFPDVCYNVDCWIQLMSLDGGATLSSIDNYTSGNGYDEAWQPFINQAANTTSSILWKLSFKVAGTAVDTTLGYVAITGVDVDGGNGISEFVEATMPSSYALYNPTTLTVTNNNGSYRATSTSGVSIASIDTSQYQAMYQINYQNINSFFYRTGAINTGAAAVRQNSIYFRSFMLGQSALPINLTYFKAQLNRNKKVDLTWATSSEVNNDHFAVERSPDNENFEAILTQPGAGTSTVNRNYKAVDENPLQGYSYYRLKQTDYDGRVCYSETQAVNNKFIAEDESALKITSVTPNPFDEKFTVSFILKNAATVNFQLVSSSGQIFFNDLIHATEGMNRYDFTDQAGLKKGIYYINLLDDDKKQVERILKN